MCHKTKNLKFEDYKKFMEANQLEKEINHPKIINMIQIVFEKIMKNSEETKY